MIFGRDRIWTLRLLSRVTGQGRSSLLNKKSVSITGILERSSSARFRMTHGQFMILLGFLPGSLSLVLGMRLFGKRSMPYWIEARRGWLGPKLRSPRILTRPLLGLFRLPNGGLSLSPFRGV